MNGPFWSTTSRFPPLLTHVNKSLIIFFLPRHHLPATRKQTKNKTAKTLTTSSHYLKFICFSKAGRCCIYFKMRGNLPSDEGEEWSEKMRVERENVEWFRWVLGFAWCLRALRNTAKMKQAAEQRGEGFHPQHYYFPAVKFKEARSLQKK